MLMVALKWQSRINPVLLPFCIVTHIGVPQRRQFTGGVLGSISGRAGTINHDVRFLVRQQCRSKLRDLVGRQVDRAGQMRVMIGGRRQSLDKQKRFSAIDLHLQLIP